MSYTASVTLALGLSMDAFAASLSQGAAVKKRQHLRHALSVGTAFGLAQGLMPLLGWWLGLAFKGIFEAVDHWIAFVLLLALGGRMIAASFSAESGTRTPVAKGRYLAVLAIATSIDAAAAGITLALFEIPVPVACAIIGVVTFLVSIGGVMIGRSAGHRLGSMAEIVGGLTLIALGTKILLQHLGVI
jgi:putative Mn2+ efflux pump MntP